MNSFVRVCVRGRAWCQGTLQLIAGLSDVQDYRLMAEIKTKKKAFISMRAGAWMFDVRLRESYTRWRKVREWWRAAGGWVPTIWGDYWATSGSSRWRVNLHLNSPWFSYKFSTILFPYSVYPCTLGGSLFAGREPLIIEHFQCWRQMFSFIWGFIIPLFRRTWCRVSSCRAKVKEMCVFCVRMMQSER